MPTSMPTDTEEQKPQGEAKQKDLQRPSAEDIYEQVATNARQELERSSLALAISGFGAGAFMGLSALGTAIGMTLLAGSPRAHPLAYVLPPGIHHRHHRPLPAVH